MVIAITEMKLRGSAARTPPCESAAISAALSFCLLDSSNQHDQHVWPLGEDDAGIVVDARDVAGLVGDFYAVRPQWGGPPGWRR